MDADWFFPIWNLGSHPLWVDDTNDSALFSVSRPPCRCWLPPAPSCPYCRWWGGWRPATSWWRRATVRRWRRVWAGVAPRCCWGSCSYWCGCGWAWGWRCGGGTRPPPGDDTGPRVAAAGECGRGPARRRRGGRAPSERTSRGAPPCCGALAAATPARGNVRGRSWSRAGWEIAAGCARVPAAPAPCGDGPCWTGSTWTRRRPHPDGAAARPAGRAPGPADRSRTAPSCASDPARPPPTAAESLLRRRVRRAAASRCVCRAPRLLSVSRLYAPLSLWSRVWAADRRNCRFSVRDCLCCCARDCPGRCAEVTATLTDAPTSLDCARGLHCCAGCGRDCWGYSCLTVYHALWKKNEPVLGLIKIEIYFIFILKILHTWE